MSETKGFTTIPWEVFKLSPTIIEQQGTGVPVASMILPGRYDNYDDANDVCKANAELIVKAVNSHQKLVDALKAIATSGGQAIEDGEDVIEYDGLACARIARAALKKAGEQ